MRAIPAAATAIVLALSLPAGALAQSPAIGFRFGWTRAGFGGERVLERTALGGPSVGGWLTFQVSPRVAIQPELALVQKGATRTSSFVGVANGDTVVRGRTTSPLRLSYLEVPLLVSYTFPAGPGRVRPYLAAGPYFAHLLHAANYLDELAGGGVATGDSVSVGEAFLNGTSRRDDVGAAVAGGFRLPLGRRLTAVVDARYERGWRSVVTSGGAVRNRALAVTGGVALPLGGTR